MLGISLLSSIAFLLLLGDHVTRYYLYFDLLSRYLKKTVTVFKVSQSTIFPETLMQRRADGCKLGVIENVH